MKNILPGVRYPIIQAPMLGVSTPEMAAAVCNEGGLGSLAVGGLSPEVTHNLIRRTKSLTEKPFAVNLFVHDIPDHHESELEAMRQFILDIAGKRGYKLDRSDLTGFHHYSYHDQVDVLLQEKISIISFTFGFIDMPTTRKLKDHHCTLIGTATCLQEAILLQEHEVDMIAVQGIEAGGHRGTFINDIPLPQVGLSSLLSQIRQKMQIPLIAAGGINSGNGIRAALDLGAAAVQIGTPFIGTTESVAIPSYKQRLTQATGADTTLTRSFSGRWARGIRNQMMKDIDEANLAIPQYPFQNSLTARLRKLAQQNNDSDYTNLWAGQSVGEQHPAHTRDVFTGLVREWNTTGNS